MERGAERAKRERKELADTHWRHRVCLLRYYIGVGGGGEASYKLTDVELSNTMKRGRGKRTVVAGGTDGGSWTGCPQSVNKNSLCFL